jgi:cobalamin biosynthesis protein CobT
MKFESPQEATGVYELPRVVKNPEVEILAEFTPEQIKEIKQKQRVLSSVAYFIGKDFKIPVELNAPGAGWHWDFKNNVIRIDPRDLLEKPMEYLHFVIAHEGGHRRVSRVDFIPSEVWQQPGFSFMMNAIEDPRMNNFVADKYPKFREDMKVAYELMAQIEEEMRQKAKGELGFQPRFKQAGFEYIRQWFRETQGKKFELSKDLPADVRTVVEQTLSSAQYSWSVYPSPDQADKSEELITDYARVSYEINRDEVWLQFKKLVEKDKADQEAQEFLQDQKKTRGGRDGQDGEGSEQGDGSGLPQELKDKLTPEEIDSLEKAIDKAIEQNKENAEKERQSPSESETKGVEHPVAIDLDSLSPELKQKIRDYIKSLPEDKKSELSKRAEKALQQFEQDFTEKMQGKLNQKEESVEEKTEGDKQTTPESPEEKNKKEQHEKERQELRETLRKILESNQTEYDRHIRELSGTIFDLENRLRNIFRERKARRFEAGKKSGSRVNIKKRISELAKEVPSFKSRSWERREMPSEKDYAISLLVDLSGSMTSGDKIGQAFRAVIVLAEVLNRLSIKTEILGFNDRLHEYQAFSKSLTEEVRSKIGTMVNEVNSSRAMYNDDGWAVQEASKRLAKQEADQKFLVVLSDGIPEESNAHSGSEYDLGTVVKNILDSKKQKIVGLGLGSGTDHVRRFYPKSIAGIPVEELPEKLAELLKDIVENYDKY